MKRTLLFALFVLLVLCSFAVAESIMDRQSLSQYSIEELYELEDNLVGALSDVFAKGSSESPDGDVFGTWVINTRTNKFHYPYCPSALQIGNHREFESCAVSELVERGYAPCGQCKPYPEK